MALISGALLLALYPESNNPLINCIGGAAITLAVIVSIYEVMMIVFAVIAIECVNHPARLLVVSSYRTIVATIGESNWWTGLVDSTSY
jgi:hypothetical protein